MRHLVMVGLWLCVTATGAAQIDPTEKNPENTESVLTLDQVMVLVLENNPELQGAAYAGRAMAARIKSARQTPAMSLGVDFENFAGSGDNKGSDSLESTLRLSTIFELGNKRGLREQVAQHQSRVFSREQDARRLDILAQAARQFIHVVIDQSNLDVARDKLALMQRSYKVVDQRVRAGRSHVAERRRTAIALARAEIELEHARHELQTSRVRLATLWGETRFTYSEASADLFAIKQPVAFEKLAQLIEQNPDLVRFASEQRLAEARVQLARAKRSANIEVSAGIRHFNKLDDNAFVLSTRIPFGLNSRAQPVIEEQQLRAQQVPFDYQKQKLQVHSSLFAIYQELQHSYEAARVLQQRIIPQAQQALREYERGYSVGRFSFLELRDAQQTLLAAKLDAVTTAANYHRFNIEIDRLTGAGLVTGVTP